MNMQKALQHLYKAVSGQDTSKVNISKLLVDIHQSVTGEEPANKNNWSRIIDSMAENWSGDSNPNQVRTITGTVTNPWGDLDPNDLRTWILLKDATALMTITVGEQVGQAYLMAGNDGFIDSSATDGGDSGDSGFLTLRVTWRFGELVHFWTMQGANGAYQYLNLVSMASQCPTTLKIIWHPLPVGD